jgi:hypothetical protein
VPYVKVFVTLKFSVNLEGLFLSVSMDVRPNILGIKISKSVTAMFVLFSIVVAVYTFLRVCV